MTSQITACSGFAMVWRHLVVLIGAEINVGIGPVLVSDTTIGMVMVSHGAMGHRFMMRIGRGVITAG